MPSGEDLAWTLKLPEMTVAKNLSLLVTAGLFDQDLTPHDWDDLQFESDTSRERQRKFRERHSKQPRDVTVTLQEQNRPEQIQSREELPPPILPQALALDSWFEEVYARHPKKKDRILAEQAIASGISSGVIVRVDFDRSHKAWCATDAWKDKNGQFAPSLAAWIHDQGFKFMPEGTPVKLSKKAKPQAVEVMPSDPEESQFKEWRKQNHGY